MNRCPLALSATTWALALAACSSALPSPVAAGGADVAAGDSQGNAPAGDAADVPPTNADAVPACPAASQYAKGQSWFSEATDQWQLTNLGVVGNQLSVTDVDGDGRPDVLVRNGGGPDVVAPGKPARYRWLLRNTGKGFEDVSVSSGLFARRSPGQQGENHPGATLASADVDNDGDLDVFVGTGSDGKGGADAPSNELYLNNGKGVFSLGPKDSAARMAGKPSAPMGAAFADVDRDGALDLWLTHNMVGNSNSPLQDRLFRGNGDGTFSDVTKQFGLYTLDWTMATLSKLNNAEGHSWAWSAAACDLNGDGWPELLASSYGRAPNHLWQAVAGPGGALTYSNVSVLSGYAFDDGMDWTDNESARCHCKDVPTDPGCKNVPPPTLNCAQLKAAFGGNYRWNHASDREPWRLGGNSGTTVCADIDNDGKIDLLTNEIKHWDVGSSSDVAELLLNLGGDQVQFARPGNDATGLTRSYPPAGWDEGMMTSAVFDFDNDGWQDVYIGASDYPNNHALLWRQDAPRHFLAVPQADFFAHNRAQGNAVADFDGDGDLDLMVGHAHMRCEGSMGADCYPTQQVRLFLNSRGHDGNWLQLELRGGPGSNRLAVGARVRVTAGGVTQTADVDGGHGQGGLQRHHVLHFGLGAACSAQVEVRWPDGVGSISQASVAGRARYRWQQGQAPVMLTSP